VGVVIGNEAGVVSESAYAREPWKCPRLDHHAGDLWMVSEILVGRSRQRGYVLARDRAIWSHRQHVAFELDFQQCPFLPVGMEHTAAADSAPSNCADPAGLAACQIAPYPTAHP
jgi:hypothetical protein